MLGYWLLLLLLAPSATQAAAPNPFREDARSIEPLINQNYAYLARFPNGRVMLSEKLRAEAEKVDDKRSLLSFAERALLVLADHHAITGSSHAGSWAVVPSYSDLWIEKRGGEFLIEAVRKSSPAERAGVRPGDRLVAVAGVPAQQAVDSFWADLGMPSTEAHAGFAARILAAGRRATPRRLSIRSDQGRTRELNLSTLYSEPMADHMVLQTSSVGDDLLIKVNDSLGRDATVTAFDDAMTKAKAGQRVIIDLTDTPSGGNTVVARAIMGWFVSAPTAYQVHNLPAEERTTGIPRQWIEQVLPRRGKHHSGPVTVRVGRWTGSMGEGLAIGFNALGANVVGSRMAGLRGAIYDHRLNHSGLVLKIPTERLLTTTGTPREEFVPTLD